MAKNSPVSSATESTVVAEPEKSKTHTNWDIFVEAGFGVASIVCDCLPGHPSDEACKTAIRPTAQNVLDHVRAGHGGGFMFTVRDAGAKVWKGWKELEAAGAEIAWIQNQVNDEVVEQTARALKAAMKPQRPKFRGAYQAFNHMLLFNIYLPSVNSPATSSDTDDDDGYSE